MQIIPASTEVIWLYMGPMRHDKLKPAAKPVMTNKNVADYNTALMEEVHRSERPINVWRFVNESNIIDDGMHLDVPTLEYTTKVCNIDDCWGHELILCFLSNFQVLLQELCRLKSHSQEASFIQYREMEK